MIYKFKSAATGDVVMLGPDGDQMLRLLGREPAERGIIEVAAMDAALDTLQRAIAAAEQATAEGDPARAAEQGDPDGAARPPVGLRQRLWPMVEMLRRARAADRPVVWGV